MLSYSEYFGVSARSLEEKGVYNAYVDEDSDLHIDPSLLKKCTIPEFQNAYNVFLAYFSEVFHLVAFADKSNRAMQGLIAKLTFKEVGNTGLGYAKGAKLGNAIGGKLSKNIASSIIEIYKMGIQDPVIFELLPFFEEGIGADRISDMTTAVLLESFLSYTNRVCYELNIPQQKCVTYRGQARNLPVYNGRGIIFVPQSILCKLPKATDWDDIDTVSDYNNRLRRRICQTIGLTWKEAAKLTKSQIRDFLFSNSDELKELLSAWKSLSHLSFEEVEKNKTLCKMFDKEDGKPYVFISYSWDDIEHKKWVKRLADGLVSKEIGVWLDQNLSLGTPLVPFMMKGIKKADKVLIIGTPTYKEKAEQLEGGTNFEDQIINVNILRKFDDNKFIPILRKGNFDDSFTDLVGNRTGLDFSEDSNFDELLSELAVQIKKSLD